MPKSKAKPKTITSTKQLAGAIGDIGKLGRQIAEARARMDAEIAKLSTPHLGQIAKLTQKLESLDERARDYCHVHRDELLGGGGKTAQLATGKVQFKQGRGRVSVEDDEAEVVGRLLQAGYRDAVRIVEQVNKQYILAHAEIAAEIAGLAVEEGEEIVVIKPTSIS